MVERVRALPVKDWPAADCCGWERACIPARRLSAGGAAGRMKPAAQQTHARAYGYLLDFCRRAGILNLAAGAASTVTPEAIDLFLAELRTRVGSVTRWSYIQKIRRVAEIMAHGRDFGWLREIEGDLRYDARPRSKHDRIVDSTRLLGLGLDLINRGETAEELTDLRRARLVRDGLMIALLSVCPIRLRNLHSLRLGKQIRRTDGIWWIILEGSETKSGRPDERPLPDLLTPHIDRWVARWRDLFLHPGDAFWPSTKGGAIAYTYVGTIITEMTRRELGTAVNPHLFRDCAVHTVAYFAGDQMGIASAILSHTDPRVTEKHYNEGASIRAAKKYQDILHQLAAD